MLTWRVPYLGMWRRVVLVRNDVSEDLIASTIRVEGVGELGTLAVTSNWSTLRRQFLRSVLQLLVTANVIPILLVLSTLMIEAIRSSETSVLTRHKRHHIKEDGILHSHRRENLKSCLLPCRNMKTSILFCSAGSLWVCFVFVGGPIKFEL
jgi:hypothetical protein